MITSEELLKQTGITESMFLRLKDLGIVSKAMLQGKGEGGGRGVVGLYPDETVSIIEWVKTKHNEGLSLNKIAEAWRQREVIEEEITTSAPNPDETKWAIDLFTELLVRHPGHGIGNIVSRKPQSDGSVLVEIKLVKL